MFDIKNKFNLIIILNVIIYFLAMYAAAASDVNVYILFGVTHVMVMEYSEYYRIITSIFVHGDLMHLMFNMIALSFISIPVIQVTNEKFALVLYFITGLASSIGIMLFDTNTIAVGASGAIYGLFGVLLFYALKQYRRGDNTLIRTIGPILILNVMISFMPGISLSGHLTGLVVGFVMTYFYDKKTRRYF